MKRFFTPITRIAFGLTCLSAALVLAAATLGFIPDQGKALIERRRVLTEALAVNCSLFASQGDLSSIRMGLQQAVRRNPDLLSANLRGANDKLVVEVKSPDTQFSQTDGSDSELMRVSVPIIAGKRTWGTLNLRFSPLRPKGVIGWAFHPLTTLLLFLSVTGFIAFYLYMRSTLQYLDPSKVMPGRVRQALDTLADGLMVLDRNERIVHTNDAFLRLVGLPGVDLRGRPASKLPWRFTEDDQPRPMPWSKALKGEAFETGVKLGMDIEGLGERTFLVNSSSILDDEGTSRGALVSFDDVTALESSRVELRGMLDKLKRSRDEIQRQNEELEQIARLDPLTSCLNRRAFYSEFELLWSIAQRYDKPLSCVMVDVDHFKSVNDRFGHSVGDVVLERVAKTLLDCARDTDLVCRYGGEEFCVLLAETDEDGAERMAERCRNAIEELDCIQTKVTASLGLSTRAYGASDPRELLDQADMALYAAKNQGRNRVIRWVDVPADAPTEAPEPSQQEAEEEHEEVTLIPFQTVSALTSALAFRDARTAEHSQRVADLTATAADGLLPPSEIYMLEVAALLHDIGKIGVPDAILHKPGKLNNDEWRVMRSHDRMGASIIQAAFGSEALMELIRTHHAWYANPGVAGASDEPMPSGDDLSIGSRILAIAEAYDTMVSGAVYRPAIDREQAFSELRTVAGTQFDPEIVEHFIRRIEARDASRGETHIPIQSDAVDEIAANVEQLARALEDENTSAVGAAARHIKGIAARNSDHQLNQLAAELELLAAQAGDMTDVATCAQHLLQLCETTLLSSGDGCQPADVRLTGNDQHQPSVEGLDSPLAPCR